MLLGYMSLLFVYRIIREIYKLLQLWVDIRFGFPIRINVLFFVTANRKKYIFAIKKACTNLARFYRIANISVFYDVFMLVPL